MNNRTRCTKVQRDFGDARSHGRNGLRVQILSVNKREESAAKLLEQAPIFSTD
jgi:hypothetical protein